MGNYSRIFLPNAPLYVAIFFILIVFALGGGARYDITSLIFLRPIAVIVITYAALVVTRDQISELSKLWVLAFAGTCMVAIHLVPLPPSVWTSLPNRELAETVGATVGIEQPWRPISLVPYRTFNALFSLAIPIAGLALITILKPTQRYRLLPALLAMGVISAIVGVLQLAGPTGGDFYFYKITNDTSAVGIFSNRNHQSTFLACCIPLLAVFTFKQKNDADTHHKLFVIFSIFIGILFLMVILVNGSRSGVFVGLLGLLSIPILIGYGSLKQRFLSNRYLLVGMLLIATILVILSIWFARGESLARAANFDKNDELRIMVWPPIFKAAVEYFPIGSGFGTFEEVYKVIEPSGLLSFTYLNHAHNDWLEMFLTGGLPAVLFIGACLFGWARAAVTLFRHTGPDSSEILFGRLGVVITFLLGVASLADYPLRTPSLSLIFAVSVGWMMYGVGRDAP